MNQRMFVQNGPTDECLVTNVAHKVLGLRVNEEVGVEGPWLHKSFAARAAQKLRPFFVVAELVSPQACGAGERGWANFAAENPSFFRVVRLLVFLQHVQRVAFVRAFVAGKISLVFAEQQVLLQPALLLETLHAQLAFERLFTNVDQSMLSPFCFSWEAFAAMRFPTFETPLHTRGLFCQMTASLGMAPLGTTFKDRTNTGRCISARLFKIIFIVFLQANAFMSAIFFILNLDMWRHF